MATTTPPVNVPTDIPTGTSGGPVSSVLATILGQSFDILNPSAFDDRPTNFKPESKTPRPRAYVRINPYEIGGPDTSDSDYWSVSGQAAYVPDKTDGSDPGLARIQTFAYYDHVFAVSPRLDYASGRNPNPDPSTTSLPTPKPKTVAAVRNYGLWQNEALVLYDNGILSLAGTQTSRSWDKGERNRPFVQFPPDKVPTALAVTAENEFALVTIWDTDDDIGQLAVVALEGKYLPQHTMPYMGFPNQGSWSDFKLLGYVDLPFARPTAVAAATNGSWNGPSQTGNKNLGQIDMTGSSTRRLLYDGDWKQVIATKGYALVASKTEGKAVFIDLAPLVQYMRESYLASEESFKASVDNRGPADSDFPQAFSANESIRPRVTSTFNISSPTAVLAGLRTVAWSSEKYKAYIASEDGTVHIFSPHSLMARTETGDPVPVAEIGTVQAGRNPTSMVFARFSESMTLPNAPKNSAGVDRPESPLNDIFYVVSRGDRKIDAVVVWGNTGTIYRTIRDSRMGDPVAMGVADRARILTVADFNGKKLISFRVGSLRSRDGQTEYKVGGAADYEFAGELFLPGKPFAVTVANVN